MKTETDVQTALDVILSDSDNYGRTLNYAVHYVRAARLMTGSELRTQCLYVLGNLTRWRHPRAKYVRDTLREFATR
jgi:hypothetical protein